MPTRLIVQHQSQLLPHEVLQLNQAKLTDIAPLERWWATGNNVDNAYATHGLFRYFGKFPPPIARYLIQEFSQPGQLVMDPMCGSGTTGVECLLSGRACLQIDVNPLATLLAKVKSRYLPGKRLTSALERIAHNYQPLDGLEHLVGLRNINHWFLPQTTQSLQGIRVAIENDDKSNESVKDVLRSALCATIRPVSRATTQQGRLFLDAATAREDAWPIFHKKATKAITYISQLPNATHPIRVQQTDFRKLSGDKYRGRVQLVILHPPYFNAYRYSRINSLELSWLGVDPSTVRKNEVREFFKVGKLENAQLYIKDIEECILQAGRYLTSDGIVGLMIGDTRLQGQHVKITRQLLDRVKNKGFQVLRIALRAPRFGEASWVASQRRQRGHLGTPLADYVVLLRPTKPC